MKTAFKFICFYRIRHICVLLSVLIVSAAIILTIPEKPDYKGYWRAESPGNDYYILGFIEDRDFIFIIRDDKSTVNYSDYTMDADKKIKFPDSGIFESAVISMQGIIKREPVLNVRFYKDKKSVRYRTITQDEFKFRSIFEGDFSNGSFSNSLFTGNALNVKYRDGRIYSGRMENSLFHGRGELFFPDSIVYKGNFKLGKSEGKGKLIFPGSIIFTGIFREAAAVKNNETEPFFKKLEAEGSVKFREGISFKAVMSGSELFIKDNDGTLYQGSLKERVREGEGRLLYPDGREYKGMFLAGRPHGKGVLSGMDGELYEGIFAGGLFHGPGVLKTSDSKVLSGSFNRGFLEGPGKLEDSAVYTGNFVKNIPSGKGELYYAETAGHYFVENRKTVFAELYKGDFVSGKPEGAGTLFYDDGTVYMGFFSDGYPHGKGTITFPYRESQSLVFDMGLPEDLRITGNAFFLYSSINSSDADFPDPEWFFTDRNYFKILRKNSADNPKVKDLLFREIRLLENIQKNIRNRGFRSKRGYVLYNPEITEKLNLIHISRNARVRLLETILADHDNAESYPLDFFYPREHVYRFFSLESSNIQGGFSGEVYRNTDFFEGYDEKQIIDYLESLPVSDESLAGKKIFFVKGSNKEFGAVHANGQIVIYNWTDKSADILKMIAHEIGHEAGYIIFGRDYYINENRDAKKEYASLYSLDVPVDSRIPWEFRLAENFAEDFAMLFGGFAKWSFWEGAEQEDVETFIINSLENSEIEKAVLIRDNIKVIDDNSAHLFFGGFSRENIHVTRSSSLEVQLENILTGEYSLYGLLKNDFTGKPGRIEAENNSLVISLEGFKEAGRPVFYELDIKLYYYDALQKYHTPSIARLYILRY